MSDFFNISREISADVQIFINQGDLADWRVWNKPRGANMIYFFVLGAGGGGGGGFTSASGTARGGGGGGNSGTISKMIIPAFMVPDMLYIRTGVAGIGGLPSAAGGTGGISYVCLAPVTNNQGNIYLISGDITTLGGGRAGSATAGGAGGTVSPVPVATDGPYITSGTWQGILSQVGGIGGDDSGAVGTTIAALTGLFVSSGAGGAGVSATNTDFAGGAITGSGLVPTIAGGLAGGGHGAGGITLMKPFVSTGGAGGGSFGLGTGGNGGHAGVGSGGGGGGGGVTGGSGGNGGPGLITIMSW